MPHALDAHDVVVIPEVSLGIMAGNCLKLLQQFVYMLHIIINGFCLGLDNTHTYCTLYLILLVIVGTRIMLVTIVNPFLKLLI